MSFDSRASDVSWLDLVDDLSLVETRHLARIYVVYSCRALQRGTR